MANLVKVKKENQIKTITQSLLPNYLSNGWVQYVETKSVSTSSNSDTKK